MSRLNLYQLWLRYLEKEVSCFIKIIIEDKVQEIAKELEISNSEKEKKRQATLWKEKKHAWTIACRSTSCLYEAFAIVPMSDVFALTTSAESARSTRPMSCSSAPSGFSKFAIPTSDLSDLSAFAGSD